MLKALERPESLPADAHMLHLFRQHRGRMIQELKAIYFADESKYDGIIERLLEMDREFKEYYYFDLSWQMHLHRWKSRKERREAWRGFLALLGFRG
ncbi:MAG: hypothetical protein HS115_06945 [Spirochaetales bacterium]|nr:hypothetical protein [Spirochaetales bacterium]